MKIEDLLNAEMSRRADQVLTALGAVEKASFVADRTEVATEVFTVTNRGFARMQIERDRVRGGYVPVVKVELTSWLEATTATTSVRVEEDADGTRLMTLQFASEKPKVRLDVRPPRAREGSEFIAAWLAACGQPGPS